MELYLNKGVVQPGTLINSIFTMWQYFLWSTMFIGFRISHLGWCKLNHDTGSRLQISCGLHTHISQGPYSWCERYFLQSEKRRPGERGSAIDRRASPCQHNTGAEFNRACKSHGILEGACLFSSHTFVLISACWITWLHCGVPMCAYLCPCAAAQVAR